MDERRTSAQAPWYAQACRPTTAARLARRGRRGRMRRHRATLVRVVHREAGVGRRRRGRPGAAGGSLWARRRRLGRLGREDDLERSLGGGEQRKALSALPCTRASCRPLDQACGPLGRPSLRLVARACQLISCLPPGTRSVLDPAPASALQGVEDKPPTSGSRKGSAAGLTWTSHLVSVRMARSRSWAAADSEAVMARSWSSASCCDDDSDMAPSAA